MGGYGVICRSSPALPQKAFIASSTCCLCVSSRIVAMAFSIRTHISQPTRFCFFVARLLQTHGSYSSCQRVIVPQGVASPRQPL